MTNDDDLKVEGFSLEEAQNNPMIFEERVKDKLEALLEKYGWTLGLSKLAFDGENHHLILNASKRKA